jgi:hypothetical protein
MDESITISSQYFKFFVIITCIEGFCEYAWRYYRIPDDPAHNLFLEAEDILWKRIKAGEKDLLLNPKRSLERIGVKICKRYLFRGN